MQPVQPGFDATTTRAAALATLRHVFAEARLDTPALDARLLAAGALGLDRSELALRPDWPLGAEGAAQLETYAARRLSREPVARILGWAEFWSLPFELSPDTLVPRPDTETVVEAAVAALPQNAVATIVDLGTGSGCILTSILHEVPQARGLGVDLASHALATARRNAIRNGVAARACFAVSRWASAVSGPFDLVVSNPPYIRSGDLAGLAPEAGRHDPGLALDGGPDGLDAYHAILGDAPRLLAPGGALVLEIGFDQEAALRGLAAAHGLVVETARRDLAGHIRALTLRFDGHGRGETSWIR